MVDAIFAVIENDVQRNELSDFYRKNKNRFYMIAFSRLHNRHDAEDAVMEAFARIADKPERFFAVPPEKRVNYMVIVVRNVAICMFNQRNRIPIVEFNEKLENPISDEDKILGRILSNELTEFIKTLPTLQQDVLTLRCFMGLSTADTAESLGISQSAVKERLCLARKSIRKFVEEDRNYE